MNLWIIAIIVGLLVIAGVFVANFSVAKSSEKISCSSCNGKCSEDRNCGLETCAALNGGKCGCGG